MRTLLLILDTQAEKFERTAAEYDVEFRVMERSTESPANYYEVIFNTPSTLFHVGVVLGHWEGINTATAAMDRTLQN